MLLIFFSCATVPTGPLGLGELRLLSIDVPRNVGIKQKSSYEVGIHFKADGEPEIETACFSWSGDRPRCYKVHDVEFGSPGTIKVRLRTIEPGEYMLLAYVEYVRDGKKQKTNVVSSQILVKGRKESHF